MGLLDHVSVHCNLNIRVTKKNYVITLLDKFVHFLLTSQVFFGNKFYFLIKYIIRRYFY